MNNVANNIRKLRLSKGWSQADISQKIHKSQSAYAKIENGITKVDYDMLEELAKIFEVNIADLMNNDDTKINNYNNSKISNSPGFVDNFYTGMKEAQNETIKSIKETHSEAINDLKRYFEESILSLKESHFHTVRELKANCDKTLESLKEEINYLRSIINK